MREMLGGGSLWGLVLRGVYAPAWVRIPRVCSALLHCAPGTLCPHRSAAQAGVLALGHAGLGRPDTSPSHHRRLQGAWQGG